MLEAKETVGKSYARGSETLREKVLDRKLAKVREKHQREAPKERKALCWWKSLGRETLVWADVYRGDPAKKRLDFPEEAMGTGEPLRRHMVR